MSSRGTYLGQIPDTTQMNCLSEKGRSGLPCPERWTPQARVTADTMVRDTGGHVLWGMEEVVILLTPHFSLSPISVDHAVLVPGVAEVSSHASFIAGRVPEVTALACIFW